jgi:hypothetical protein
LDIGVLGYIGIVWPKEHSPEVRSFPPGTPCICTHVCCVCVCVCMYVCMCLAPRADSLRTLHINIPFTLLWRFGPYSCHGLHSSKYCNALYVSFSLFSSGWTYFWTVRFNFDLWAVRLVTDSGDISLPVTTGLPVFRHSASKCPY